MATGPSADSTEVCYRAARRMAFSTGVGRAYFTVRAWRHARRRDPFLPYFNRYGCIFVHIPKCAGSAVRSGLFGDTVQRDHDPIATFYFADTIRARRYLSFTVVRDPFDRFASAFYYLKAGGGNARDAAFAADVLADFDDVDALARALAQSARLRADVVSWHHFIPQVWYTMTPGGRRGVDVVLTQEKLDADLPKIAARLGIAGAELPRVNRSRRPRTTDGLFSAAGADAVRRIYARDFAAFGYDPGDPS